MLLLFFVALSVEISQNSLVHRRPDQFEDKRLQKFSAAAHEFAFVCQKAVVFEKWSLVCLSVTQKDKAFMCAVPDNGFCSICGNKAKCKNEQRHECHSEMVV